MNPITSQTTSISLISAEQLEGMDLETALMSVQSDRAKLLDAQLREQLNEVKSRNQAIANLNTSLAACRELLGNFPADAGNDKKISDIANDQWKKSNDAHKKTQQTTKDVEIEAQRKIITDAEKEQKKIVDDAKQKKIKKIEEQAPWQNQKVIIEKANQAIKSIKSRAIDSLPTQDSDAKTRAMMDKFEASCAEANISLDIKNKGDLQTATENIKGLIDAESNSQQMDMVRLQSLSNKRNEAFEIITNFIKKSQDNRSSIISNTR